MSDEETPDQRPMLRVVKGDVTPDRHRPAVRPNLTLALMSAALTAALFLLVLLVVEGWRR